MSEFNLMPRPFGIFCVKRNKLYSVKMLISERLKKEMLYHDTSCLSGVKNHVTQTQKIFIDDVIDSHTHIRFVTAFGRARITLELRKSISKALHYPAIRIQNIIEECKQNGPDLPEPSNEEVNILPF